MLTDTIPQEQHWLEVRSQGFWAWTSGKRVDQILPQGNSGISWKVRALLRNQVSTLERVCRSLALRCTRRDTYLRRHDQVRHTRKVLESSRGRGEWTCICNAECTTPKRQTCSVWNQKISFLGGKLPYFVRHFAAKAEDTKAGEKVRETLSADDVHRSFLSEYDKNIEYCKSRQRNWRSQLQNGKNKTGEAKPCHQQIDGTWNFGFIIGHQSIEPQDAEAVGSCFHGHGLRTHHNVPLYVILVLLFQFLRGSHRYAVKLCSLWLHLVTYFLLVSFWTTGT